VARTTLKTDIWDDPAAYLRWPLPNTHAARELLFNIDHPGPRLVVDLGCGPGNNTELTAGRWPDAFVLGIDNSPSMIGAAQSRRRPGRLEFREGDLREWEPDDAPDVVLLNTVLQWVPDHMALLPRLAGFLAPGGVLGFQIPGVVGGTDSLMEPVFELAATEAWRGKLHGALPHGTLHDPFEYLTVLGDAGLEAKAWETNYWFPLGGECTLAEYSAGTLLRPMLARLSPEDANPFLAAYAQRQQATQPAQLIGGKPVEILRQHRVFAVGRRLSRLSPGDSARFSAAPSCRCSANGPCSPSATERSQASAVNTIHPERVRAPPSRSTPALPPGRPEWTVADYAREAVAQPVSQPPRRGGLGVELAGDPDLAVRFLFHDFHDGDQTTRQRAARADRFVHVHDSRAPRVSPGPAWFSASILRWRYQEK
jgi:trans-aconitate 2-methyltransferase